MRNDCSLLRKIPTSFLFLFFIFLLHENSFAQTQKTIRGIVRDSKGQPLAAVNVLVKGTANGAETDTSGRFLINAGDNSVLIFSYIGAASKEVPVNGQTTLAVQLEADDKSLNDVVVVGYGTQKKVNVIGSVVTVSNKDITAAPVTNIANALAGRLPGAVIQQSNGEPGKDAATIVIRGTATLGDNSPLIVVDGVIGRDMNTINGNDVESVSVLKDASAAIYGARAANGVILVTTKRGKGNVPLAVNYNFYQGFSTPTALPKMASAADYASMIREMQLYDGVDETQMTYSAEDVEKYSSGQFPWTHPNTDWVDASFRKFSQTRSHHVSLNGGNEAVNYYVSFGTQQDEGIFKKSATKFNRYNLKATFDAKVNEYLTLGLDLNGAQENRNYPSTSAGFNLDGAIKSLPTSPAVYPNGLPGPDIAYGQNPVVTVTDATGFDDSTNYRIYSTFSANLKIPWVEGLSLSSYYAYDLNTGSRKFFQKPWTLYSLDVPAYLAAGNTGVEDGSEFLVGSLKGTSEPSLRNYANTFRMKTFNLKADYTKTFGGHSISAFVALETAEYDGKGFDAFRRYFISDQLPYLFFGGDQEKNNSEFVTVDSRVNYFTRISYNLNETYMFQFSFRRDGSVRFPENSRWGNFPAFLAGWRISNEDFWKNNISFIDYFKLKASWGQMGNDIVAPFQYLPSYGLSTGYVLNSQSYLSGLSLAGVANPNITWEVANLTNVGFESLWFGNKFSFSADFFSQRRKQILVRRSASVPDFTGLALPDENFGVVDLKGFELVAGYNDRISQDLSYSLSGNFAFARNKVVDFDEAAKTVEWQVLTGKPQAAELMYHAIGIYTSQDEIDKSVHVPGARPGDIIIEDVDGDGEIEADDRILNTKTVNPEITFGLTFGLTYKNWSLNGLIQGAENSSRRVLVELQGLAGNFFAYDAEGRWTPDNTNASKPRAFDRNNVYWRSGYVTDYSYQDGGYARLKNLQLAYTFPASLYSKIKLKGAQIYASGQNLFLIYNKNKYLDPEVGGIRTNTSMSPNSGVYSYPIMKVFSIGARISL
jgi:TonB-linked SusC/RagA family outer membrane protein